MIKYLTLSLVLIGFALPVFAQDLSSKEPIEITADGALEWLRDESKYVARDNAKATQGDMSISGNTLEAFYNPQQGTTSITNFVATGNVVTVTPDGTVRGSKATYDVKTGKALFTGNNLKVDGAGDNNLQKLTARDSLHYDRLKNVFTATGNVVIISGKEKATADKATYSPTTTTATLEGNVKITQGTTILEGARAKMNTKTGISQLFADPSTKRVKAVFYPK